jgi:hypothetical protein
MNPFKQCESKNIFNLGNNGGAWAASRSCFFEPLSGPWSQPRYGDWEKHPNHCEPLFPTTSDEQIFVQFTTHSSTRKTVLTCTITTAPHQYAYHHITYMTYKILFLILCHKYTIFHKLSKFVALHLWRIKREWAKILTNYSTRQPWLFTEEWICWYLSITGFISFLRPIFFFFA